MNIYLGSEEILRVHTNRNEIFVDVSTTPSQECLTVQFYQMHSHQIRFKSGVYKLFVFESDDFDFGWWSDAEVIWSSKNKNN